MPVACPRFRWKTAVALLSAIAFFLSVQGSFSTALAADATVPPPSEPPAPAPSQTWETWPKKAVEPGVELPAKPAEAGAAAAGEAGGKKTSAGLSAGTIGWIALGLGAAIAIGVAAVGGGGGTTTTPAHP